MWASGRADENGPEGPEGVESRRRAAGVGSYGR